MRASLGSVCWRLAVLALATYGYNGSLAQSFPQQNTSCLRNIQLTVNGTSSLDTLYSSLLEAGACGTNTETSVSVEWEGTVEVDRPISVPDGVELRVQGGGYVYGTNSFISTGSSNSSGGGGDDSDSTGAVASVIRGNGSVHLFTVEPNGKLYISGMTLQNGWGGDYGGGGVYAYEYATIICETCLWDSLSAFGPGGAIAAKRVANLTLQGINTFSGCSSSSSESRGGAVYLDATTLTAQGNVRFENCSTGGKGGGLYMTTLSRLIVEEAASLSFSGCTAGSQVGDNGGAMCSYDSTVTVGSNATVSFEDNSVRVEGDGGGLYAKSTSIVVNSGANISFINNHAGDDGGGMHMSGMGADEYDGEEDMITCFTLAQRGNVVFIGNSAGDNSGNGGGLHFGIGCDVVIKGGVHFEENTGVRAGAMYLDQSKAVISGRAIFINNTAERWGGAVMLAGFDSSLKLNGTAIAQNNSAGRSGGAIYLENGHLVVVEDSGARGGGMLWEGNYAGYDGGAVAVDGGEVHLEGGFGRSNRAAQRGGVLFATGESVLSWKAGESFDNSAAAGGSLYISNSKVNLTDVRLVGDHTPSGGVIFFAGANARVINASIIAPGESVGDFALHVDSKSVLRAFSCSFEMWRGDNNLIVNEGELVLDACDFSQSSNSILVRALMPATIRNAILGDNNYNSAGENAFTVFGSGVHECSNLPEHYSCQNNEQKESCIDTEHGMGVLCAAYIVAATGNNVSLSGVGSPIELVAISASENTSPSSSSFEDTVYYPDLIIQKLIIRYSSAGGDNNSNISQSSSEDEGAAGMGAKAMLWELRSFDGNEYEGSPIPNGRSTGVSANNFSWVAMPASGILMKDQEVTIRFVGSPSPPQDPTLPSAVYNGNVSAAFHVLSRTAEAGSATMSNVNSFVITFYYCEAGAFWDGERCVLCAEILSVMVDGDGSLECDMPGVTLVTLPLATGYWRGDINSTNVQPCLLHDACKGGRGVVSSNSTSKKDYSEGDRYCEMGYVGPYCAVCAENFRQLSGYECLNCQSKWGAASRAVFWVVVALTPVLLVSLIMFLFGGITPFTQLQKKVGRMCGWFKPAGVTQWSTDGLETDTAAKEGEELEEEVPSRHVARARKLGTRMRHAIPLQKLKILIVVWQILTQSSALAQIPYPSTYERFLEMLDVFNFDISWALSAMCLVDELNFYEKLVILTLAPIILLGALGFSYAGAMRWHRGTGSNVIECRQQAKVRHANAALLVLFLVFSSVSTTIFSTFSCVYVEDLKVSMLRADYSISCDDQHHLFYQVYAGVMVVVYPIGIPLSFAYLLFEHRHKINPLAAVFASPTPDEVQVETFPKSRGLVANPDEFFLVDILATGVSATSPRVHHDRNACERAEANVREHRVSHGINYSSEDCGGGSGGDFVCHTEGGASERNTFGPVSSRATDANPEEVLKRRGQDLDLQPIKLLWEPYEPRKFYYEPVECGRRCLLTGALVFVLPNTAGQMAGACIFAFLTILPFELIRPHISQADTWMYRTGCIVIFFSNFLGLMAKVDLSGEKAQSQEFFGILLIFVHVIMIMAVILDGYWAIKLQLHEESASDGHNPFVPGLMANMESSEIQAQIGMFDSDNGMRRVTLMATHSPEDSATSNGAEFGPGDGARVLASTHDDQYGRGRGAVMSLPLSQRRKPVVRALVARKTTMTVVDRSRGAFNVQLTSVPGGSPLAHRDLDVSDASSEIMTDSRTSEKDQSQVQHFTSAPGARDIFSLSKGMTRDCCSGSICRGELV